MWLAVVLFQNMCLLEDAGMADIGGRGICVESLSLRGKSRGQECILGFLKVT